MTMELDVHPNNVWVYANNPDEALRRGTGVDLYDPWYSRHEAQAACHNLDCCSPEEKLYRVSVITEVTEELIPRSSAETLPNHPNECKAGCGNLTADFSGICPWCLEACKHCITCGRRPCRCGEAPWVGTRHLS
jgi:hypothetical protein